MMLKPVYTVCTGFIFHLVVLGGHSNCKAEAVSDSEANAAEAVQTFIINTLSHFNPRHIDTQKHIHINSTSCISSTVRLGALV